MDTGSTSRSADRNWTRLAGIPLTMHHAWQALHTPTQIKVNTTMSRGCRRRFGSPPGGPTGHIIARSTLKLGQQSLYNDGPSPRAAEALAKCQWHPTAPEENSRAETRRRRDRKDEKKISVSSMAGAVRPYVFPFTAPCPLCVSAPPREILAAGDAITPRHPSGDGKQDLSVTYPPDRV